MQARQTFLFTPDSLACMTTMLMNLFAALLHKFLAIFAVTNIREGWSLVHVLHLHFTHAKTALNGLFMQLVLLTGLTSVVWCDLAASAEVLFAFWASYSILAHVNS